MTITIHAACDGVRDYLAATPGLAVCQSIGDLSEDYPDTPALQVMPDSGQWAAIEGESSRLTFQAGARVRELLLRLDLPVKQRADLPEDMVAVVDMADNLEAMLLALGTKTYFGLDDIFSIWWSWERTIFLRGTREYVGVRFTLHLKTR